MEVKKHIQDSVIGKTVTVTIDRPLGSYHPKHRSTFPCLESKLCKLSLLHSLRTDQIVLSSLLNKGQ